MFFLIERTHSLAQKIVPLGPAATVRDVQNIIRGRATSRYTESHGMYSYIAGQGKDLHLQAKN